LFVFSGCHGHIFIPFVFPQFTSFSSYLKKLLINPGAARVTYLLADRPLIAGRGERKAELTLLFLTREDA